MPSPECPITDDMTYWERRELLGDDSYGYEDGVRSSPTDFYYDDLRDYKEWCERDDAEAAEGYWHAGGFVYFRDAFGPELDPVALSVSECAAVRIGLLSSELLCLHGDATIAPRDVPAVSGTVVRDTDGPDVAMILSLFGPIHMKS